MEEHKKRSWGGVQNLTEGVLAYHAGGHEDLWHTLDMATLVQLWAEVRAIRESGVKRRQR